MKSTRAFGIGRQVVYFAMVAIVSAFGHAQTKPDTLYPNELEKFKFYDQYLSPLCPYISEKSDVIRAIGSDQGKEFTGWRVFVSFVGDHKSNTVNGHLWAQNITGRLASLDLVSRKRVSMRHVTFPAVFAHSYGSISESNLSFDVYSDGSGLEYWIHAQNSRWGKKGDLMRIIYGPSDRLKRQIQGAN
ncbi:MAG TPA: hypothetical protein VIB39_09965 [Candidatus Angelobacter sp.]|jgi:hypothetical protein